MARFWTDEFKDEPSLYGPWRDIVAIVAISGNSRTAQVTVTLSCGHRILQRAVPALGSRMQCFGCAPVTGRPQ